MADAKNELKETRRQSQAQATSTRPEDCLLASCCTPPWQKRA